MLLTLELYDIDNNGNPIPCFIRRDESGNILSASAYAPAEPEPLPNFPLPEPTV